MSSQITKRLICLWKGCDELVFEEAAAFKMHVDKHIHEQMQMDLDNQKNDGTEEQQQEDEPLRRKAKLNEDKMASGAGNGEREIICMAIEVWTDVFGFVKRIQLARTICLTNRHIHRICWPRLHGNKVEAFQSREITIVGRERYDRDRPPKALVLKDGKAMPIPSCPVPPYISGFYCIKIEFLDQQVLAFFAHIIPCLAKSGVKISLRSNKSDAKQYALLDQLLNILEDGLPKNKLYSHVPNIHSPYLLDMYNKMEQIILSLNDYTDIPVLMKILASPRPDGQQRVIYVPSRVRYLTWVMLKDIKEDFHSSIQRLSQPFYIRFYPSPRHSVQSSVETNELTNEQLTIMPTVNHSYLWDICRHPRGQYEQWAEDGRNRVKSASENERLTAINVALK